MTSARSLLLVIGALFYGVAVAAPTTALQDASQLFKQGQYAPALEKVNAYLSKNPKEAQARFLKGLVLTELNRTQDAIRVFTDLTEDYPELPEPYNNLAVLYAAQGQFDRAKNSLEMAIRTHPSYATAHENLGDIYAKMASLAYDKALQLDKGNMSAQTKLSLIRDLFGPSRMADTGSRTKQTIKPAAPKTAALSTEPAPPIPDLSPRDNKPAQPAADAGSAKPEAEAPAKPAPVKPLALPAEPKAAAQKLLQAWAAAWSRRDVDTYLGFYADNYKADKSSHADWAEERRARITRPSAIEVELSNVKVEVKGAAQVVASFKQRYESNLLKAASNKRITLEKQGGTWKIVEER